MHLFKTILVKVVEHKIIVWNSPSFSLPVLLSVLKFHKCSRVYFEKYILVFYSFQIRQKKGLPPSFNVKSAPNIALQSPFLIHTFARWSFLCQIVISKYNPAQAKWCRLQSAKTKHYFHHPLNALALFLIEIPSLFQFCNMLKGENGFGKLSNLFLLNLMWGILRRLLLSSEK